MPDQPLAPVCSQWLAKIKLAWDVKKKKFQNDADEAMQFYNGPYDWLYGATGARKTKAFMFGGDDDDFCSPSMRMTVNKVAELVQLFGPALYHRNPKRQVNPRQMPDLPLELLGDPADPNVQAMVQQVMMEQNRARVIDKTRATLLQTYLNYTPTALDLKTHSRWAIDEAMIKGMGLLMTEVYTPAGSGTKMIGSFFKTIDDLVLDPDVELIQDCQWCAIRYVRPYWAVEEEYGLPQDSLKGKATTESYGRQAEVTAGGRDANYNRAQGKTNDLCVYWKVYSKMGMGGRLAGMKPDLRQPLDFYGNYVHLVMAEGVPYPLNLPTDVVASATDEEIKKRLEWPTPFWADDTWPFTELVFHSVPREIWPMSHLKPAIGELLFLNWAYSFLASKVKLACRDFIAIAKSAGEEVKNQIRTGTDYTIIEVEALHGSIDKVVSFLQHPPFNPEIYRVIEGVTKNFEQRTGLSELMYGMSSRQMRSAEEAQVKGDQINVRPDDMANKVEDFMTGIARKEALAARWHLQAEDVAPILGQVGAMFWNQFVVPSDPAEILHQLEYRIEANSARKPNQARDSANLQQAMQVLLAPFFQYAGATGNVDPVNTLVSEWGKSVDMDTKGMMLAPPPPPPEPEAKGPPSQGATT